MNEEIKVLHKFTFFSPLQVDTPSSNTPVSNKWFGIFSTGSFYIFGELEDDCLYLRLWCLLLKTNYS